MTKHKKEETAGTAPEETATAGSPQAADEIKALQDKLAEKEKEATGHHDKYVRALAELENYKKFAAREKADLLKFGNENIVKDILPCLDNLDRALDHADKTQDVEKLVDGLKMIQGQLLCCLEKHGVQKIECVGQDFDPNLHEAIQSIETDDQEDNKVMDEYQKGYLLNNRLLKAAKVSVSKRKKD
jgi:molecular chaperone GrpE